MHKSFFFFFFRVHIISGKLRKIHISCIKAIEVCVIFAQPTVHQYQIWQLVGWCFEHSQPQRITLGLETNVYLLAVLHKNHQTAKFFKIHVISLDTISIKQNIQIHIYPTQIVKEIVNQISPSLKQTNKTKTNKQTNKKHIRLEHAGIIDPSIWFFDTRLQNFFFYIE